MNYHGDLLQTNSRVAWPYHEALPSLKPGKLFRYRRERLVRVPMPDGTFGRRGFYIPRQAIVMVVKSPYEHSTGRLVCIQVLHGSKIYEDSYLAPKEMLKHLEPVEITNDRSKK